MQSINYFFASVISFLGLLVGIILIRIAPEEQKPLSKYFSLLGNIFLFLIFVFQIFYHFNSRIYLAALVFLLAALLAAEFKIKAPLKKSVLIYSVFGILFFISSVNTGLFAIESSLIFLYGIQAGSMMYSKKKNNAYKILFYSFPFVIIANLLPFLAPYL